MSEPIVLFDHVYKKFSRVQHINTLRDLVPAVLARATRLWRGCGGGAVELGEEEFWAVDDVSFTMKRGETLGIIGPNGSGKSTALKLLSGILRPERGSYRVDGRLSALIEVGAGFHPDLTGRENVFLNCSILGMKRREVRERFDEIVDFAGIREFIDTPLKYYSSGMAVRLGFATSVFTEPDVLLVDEVLAVGDMEFRTRCQERMQRMRESGVSIILVSHNPGEVRQLCDRTLLLFKGRAVEEGPTPGVLERYHQTVAEKLAASPGRDAVVSSSHGAEDRLRLVRFEMLNEEGEPATAFSSGGAVTFRVHFEARERVERPRVAFDLFWALDQTRCARFDSDLETAELGPVEGKGHVDLRVEQLLVAPNAYLLSVHLGSDRGLADSVHKVRFVVTEGLPIPGVFGLPHHFAVEVREDARGEAEVVEAATPARE
jgi:ABC-type polysaccharide/polyol phosphate transport system ATPase subunit